jgi:hypothetical protein
MPSRQRLPACQPLLTSRISRCQRSPRRAGDCDEACPGLAGIRPRHVAGSRVEPCGRNAGGFRSALTVVRSIYESDCSTPSRLTRATRGIPQLPMIRTVISRVHQRKGAPGGSRRHLSSSRRGPPTTSHTQGRPRPTSHRFSLSGCERQSNPSSGMQNRDSRQDGAAWCWVMAACEGGELAR